jgi:hypothetical protein
MTTIYLAKGEVAASTMPGDALQRIRAYEEVLVDLAPSGIQNKRR